MAGGEREGLGLGDYFLGGKGIGRVWLGGWGRSLAGGSDKEAPEFLTGFWIAKTEHGLGDSLDHAVSTIFVHHGLSDDELDFIVVLWRHSFSTGQFKGRSHLIEGFLEELSARWDPRRLKDCVQRGLDIKVAIQALRNLSVEWRGHAGRIELVQARLNVGATGTADLDQAGHQGVGGGVDDAGFSVGQGFVACHGFARLQRPSARRPGQASIGTADALAAVRESLVVA